MLASILCYTFAFPVVLEQPKKAEDENNSVVFYMRNLLAYEIQYLVLDIVSACLRGDEHLALSRSKALTSTIMAYLATPPGTTVIIATDCCRRKDNPNSFDIENVRPPALRDKDKNPIGELKYGGTKINYDLSTPATAIKGPIAACKLVVGLSTTNPRGGVDKFSFSPRRVIYIRSGARKLIWFSILDHFEWFDRMHDADDCGHSSKY